MDILDQTLLWNKQGIIQGPLESDHDFQKRALYLEVFKNKIIESLEIMPADLEKGEAILKKVFSKTRAFYDITPTFVPLFFSNKKLSFFHGGTSWIVQLTTEDPPGAFIQLKKNKVPFYEPEEILVHELSHVGRMAFECPLFEEILAWSSSPRSFRRYFGPLFSSLKETALLLFLLLSIFLVDLFSLIFGDESLFLTAQWLKIIPLFLIMGAMVRLFLRQKTFSACLSNLETIFEKKHARAVIYRLSDQEIQRFSKESPESIISYAKTNALKTLRWKTLYNAYFFDV